jgi:type II secretory pathway pseudopilin PulG
MNNRKRVLGFSGFSLVEVLVVIGIIVLLLGVITVSVRASKANAADAETKKTLSEIALKAEEQDIAPGVIDYSTAFTAIDAPSAIVDLASKLKLTEGDYQYVSEHDSYAIVFPLKKGDYYCVDSKSHATGKVVTGLFAETGPKNCDTATRVVVRPDGWDTDFWGGGDNGGGGGGSGQAPVIVLLGANPDPQPYGYFPEGVEPPENCYNSLPGPGDGGFIGGGIVPLPDYCLSYVEPGYTATDAEDGDLTSEVVINTTIHTVDCFAYVARDYSVTDSSGNTTTVSRQTQGAIPGVEQPQCGSQQTSGEDLPIQ